MRISVNGVRLYFDVEGLGLPYVDGRLHKRPPLLLLHGGPGYDHLSFKPWFSRFADVAQVIYLDHRGQGRSDESDADHWNLRQWGDDVLGFLDALNIQNVILLGHSFGGFVALEVATRAPERLGKLVLSSTGSWPNLDAADEAFRRLVGEEASAAHHAIQHDPTIENLIRYDELCNPHYNPTPRPPTASQHTQLNMPLLVHWLRGENHTFDYRPRLKDIACPTLVLAGDSDPVTPVEESEAMAAAIPCAELQIVANAGHGTWYDDPVSTEQRLRAFITG